MQNRINQYHKQNIEQTKLLQLKYINIQKYEMKEDSQIGEERNYYLVGSTALKNTLKSWELACLINKLLSLTTFKMN